MSSSLRYSDAAAGFGSWRNVMVTIFTQELHEPHLAELLKNHDDLLQRYPKGYLGIVVIEPTARSMKAELRAPTVELMAKMNKFNLAGCYVFNGNGLLTTSIRTVVSAMIMASRPARPNKASGDLGEASEWLAKQNADSPLTNETYTGAELLVGVRDLLRRQTERAGRNVAS